MRNAASFYRRGRIVSTAAGILALLGILAFGPGLCSAATESGAVADLTELSLEDLMNIEVPTVTGASKFEQKATEAPSSITVISSEEVKRYGYRTLADVLQSVQGFHVSYDRNYAFLGARGISLGDFNSRILLLVNGHRVNNNLTDGAFIDTAAFLDIDLIERVEIIRGPGSVLYGNNAFFGVVNVITREGRQINGAEVSGEYGQFDTYKGRVTFGKDFTNGLHLLLSGTVYDSAGRERLYYREFDQRISTNPGATNNGVAKGLDDDFFGSFFGSVSFRDFTLEGGYSHREKGNPTALIPASFNDSDHRTTDERSYAALKFAHNIPEVVDVSAQLYYDRYDTEIGYPVGASLFKETQLGEWWGAELQLNKGLWERHILTLGAEYRDDFRQEFRGVDESTGQRYGPPDRDRTSYGVYALGDFAVLTNLHLNAGGRYDQYGDLDPAFNPRLALIYSPLEKSTIKALYGTAFRAPNFKELSDDRFDVKPEEITSYELVYEQGIGRYLRSSVSGFYNRMEDLIVFRDGSYANFNADTKGLELALEGFWTSGMRCRMSYSLQDSEDRSTDTTPADSPTHLVKCNVSVPVLRDQIFAGLEFLYTSRRHTVFTSTTSGTLPGDDTSGSGIVNFTLYSRNLIKDLEFSASVYNLLDQEYSDPASRDHQQDSIERDGRSFRLKLTYQF